MSQSEAHDKALAQGYEDETCAKCHVFFAAHIHFIRCEVSDCPMKGQNLLEMLNEILNDEK